MNHHKENRSRQAGFSLIEVSIVLVIVGLLLGGMMLPLATQFERSQRTETRKTLEKALDAVYGYALANGRLPCPDINQDGLEDRKGGANRACIRVYGFLPWATLATGKQDAWGHALIYRVTANFADAQPGAKNPLSCTRVPTSNASFSLCSQGDIQVKDSVGGQLVALNVPAVLLSKGKNWSRLTADERENVDNDNIFVDRVYSSAEGNEYDDMMVWVVPAVLKNKLAEAGMLP